MIIINLSGIALIFLIIWWFWIYKPGEVEGGEQGITVIVENGIYSPANIKLAAGEEIVIEFLRKDTSPCASTVLFPDINIATDLPVGQTASIVLPALEKGSYPFHCQMQMYRGTIIVE